MTFGEDFDEHKYYRVLYACALNHDVNSMPAQDMSEVVVGRTELPTDQLTACD